MFLVALCFSYFAKAFSGSYMKSSITQIERRFDISSSTVGMIDGSFEIGNLMVIAIVSYFGAQFHRPRIIAAGCILMSLGSFLTAMPHFFMGLYVLYLPRKLPLPEQVGLPINPTQLMPGYDQALTIYNRPPNMYMNPLSFYMYR
eukprot:XP_017945989.1 PREDICTED: solute carrier organic anion transporter family member 1B3-like [Xenopus tropicalis]